MKYIRLYAYLYHNLGDDLMVEVLLRRYPNRVFYCDCDMPIRNQRLIAFDNFIDKEKLYEKYGRINHLLNILTFHKIGDRFFSWIFEKYAQRCRASIYIGGSLYIPRHGESLEERIMREEKKFAQEPLFIIGANFGEEDDRYEKAFCRYFSRCAGVSFRDKISYDKFKQLPHAQYAPDVVFNFDFDEYSTSVSDGSVLISVIDTYTRRIAKETAEKYERFIITLCEECVQRGKQPVLVSFCENEGDERAVERILGSMPQETRQKTKQIHYCNNVAEVLGAFGRAEYVVATRFHAMILAMKMKKPFFCISYNEKIKQVLKDLDCDRYVDLGELDESVVVRCFDKDHLPKSIDEYISQAEKQFSQFDAYITND